MSLNLLQFSRKNTMDISKSRRLKRLAVEGLECFIQYGFTIWLQTHQSPKWCEELKAQTCLLNHKHNYVKIINQFKVNTFCLINKETHTHHNCTRYKYNAYLKVFKRLKNDVINQVDDTHCICYEANPFRFLGHLIKVQGPKLFDWMIWVLS